MNRNAKVRRVQKALLWLTLASIAMAGCEERQFTPKPKGYFKIDLPEKRYTDYSTETCPFFFQHPEYSKVITDSVFFGRKTENPCWLNVHFPTFNGDIHLSYKEITPEQTLSKLIEDCHKLTFKHTIKADYIDERIITTPHQVSGMLYEVGGDAASNAQFFLTDSSQHFIRGSLYFNNPPNEDSLRPVIHFVKLDLFHLIETFRWEGGVVGLE